MSVLVVLCKLREKNSACTFQLGLRVRMYRMVHIAEKEDHQKASRKKNNSSVDPELSLDVSLRRSSRHDARAA